MNDSGFGPFWVYMTIKNIHFGNGKYDITKMKLPKRKQFTNMWNNERRDKDGRFFYRLQSIVPHNKSVYIRLFSYYWIKNPKFSIHTLFNDDFKLWYDNEAELSDVKKYVSIDFLKVFTHCAKKGIKLSKAFKSDKGYFQPIFKFYESGKISVHSLLVFDEIFGLFKNINSERLNIVDLEKYKKYEKILTKYKPIVYKRFEGIDWKSEFKKII